MNFSRLFAGWRPLLLGGVAVAAVSSSCTLLVGTFEGPGGTTSTSTSASSTGSNMTSSQSTGGASSSSSTGRGGMGTTTGTGGSGGCTIATDCPTPPNVCVLATCTAGVCGMMNQSQGTFIKKDSPGDCRDTVCDGSGNVTTEVDQTNLPPSTNPCLVGTCSQTGTPGTTAVTAGTMCSSSMNGKVCDGAGDCVQCLVAGDCPAGDACNTGHVCVTAGCMDSVQDGNETDVDCGGGTCPPCGDLKMCKVDTDCIDQICSPGGTCSAPSCTDMVQNGTETDVDCGGGACPGCGPNLKCTKGSDCIGGQCGGGTCTPDCSDMKQNGSETDVDCGGGTCPPCAVNKKCSVDPDCASGACDTVSLTCVANQCGDVRLDGNETDVDCGGGTCPPCATGKNCKVDSDCTTMACDAQSLQCDSNQCNDKQKDGLETDVDCGGGVCSTCATGKHCKVDADCTTMACNVSSLTCVSTQCSDLQKDGNETDIDCGGGTCPACATGKGCKVDADCTTAACDTTTGKCAASTCSDQTKDGSETDVDCGGGTCPTCATGLKCLVDSDCMSNACDLSTLVCVTNQCADARLDGLETDIDCGGGICPVCAAGQMCQVDTDCSTAACDGSSFTCVANVCADHRQDGNETDIDCGGADSCPRCAVGKKCNSSSDCLVGHTCATGSPHVCQ
jgi:hypothetical protein